MIANGFTIMLVGMVVVFTFLAIMVFSMRTMSGIILKFFPEKEEPKPLRAGGGDAEIAAAIAAVYAQNSGK